MASAACARAYAYAYAKISSLQHPSSILQEDCVPDRAVKEAVGKQSMGGATARGVTAIDAACICPRQIYIKGQAPQGRK
jgi:hypothetical protein